MPPNNTPPQTPTDPIRVNDNKTKKSFFKKKPKARLKIGKTYQGEKTSFIAQGVVVFREWDPKDNQFYYWEEWELTGFNDYDSWVEYDHYTKKVSIYEPIDIVERIDASSLSKGQQLQLTVNNELLLGTVKEVGVATIDYLKGKMSYQLFPDDSFTYATIATPKGEVSVEDYRLNYKNEKDYYLGRRLSRKQQKAMFGKPIHPINWQTAAVWVIMGAFIFGPSLIPTTETVCTPRTVTSSVSRSTQSQSTSNLQQDCRTRRVFFSGSGGSSVGK